MGLKVIGAGFGRTGTASLKLALETLLQGPCYHMSEVLGRAGHVQMWRDAAAGKPDWDAIFEGFEATVDFPASNYWRELAEHYPDAKVLLSVRDPQRWFESTQATIFSHELQEIQTGTAWGEMIQATINDHLDGDLNDRDAMVAAFERHSAAVKAAFGPDRLLVFEARDGWAPICELLGVPVPDEPYPHINSSQEFAGLFDMLKSPVGEAAMRGEGIGDGRGHREMFEG